MTKNDQLLTSKIISEISGLPESPTSAQVEVIDRIFVTNCIEAGGIRDRVYAEMNLHGDLTSVTIFPPDLDFDPNGWVQISEVLSQVVSELTMRIEKINLSITIKLAPDFDRS